jgi:hypothetical protein
MSAVYEAQQRLQFAHNGFAALMTLLEQDEVQVKSQNLRCLLQPLVGEVDAALDELEHLN